MPLTPRGVEGWVGLTVSARLDFLDVISDSVVAFCVTLMFQDDPKEKKGRGTGQMNGFRAASVKGQALLILKALTIGNGTEH